MNFILSPRSLVLMKRLWVLALWMFMYSFLGCSGQKASVQTETAPKFANSRQFNQSPEQIRPAARKALERLIASSEPATDSAVKADDAESRLATGWVYSQSKDKYVSVSFNGAPKRIPLKVRRKYGYGISSSLGGTTVTAIVEEEIEALDAKNGKARGWQSATPDTHSYALLLQRLQEELRAQP